MVPERPSGPWMDPSRVRTKFLRSRPPASDRVTVEVDQVVDADRAWPAAAALGTAQRL